MIMAYITPLLTYSGQVNDVALFTYLLIIAVGSIWVVAITEWRYLTPTAIIFTVYRTLPVVMAVMPGTPCLSSPILLPRYIS